MSPRNGFTSLLCGLLLGCATPPLSELERARTSIDAAKRDEVVVAKAAVALYEAEKNLGRAETAWEEEGDLDEAVHQSYLTEKRVEIARAVADRRAADEEAERLNAERQKVILGARTREIESLQQKLAAMGAKRTERGAVVTLGDVLFDFNRAELKPGAQQNLYRVVSFLRENTDRELLVEGHTDDVGSESYNIGLSQRRADAVRGFLAVNGVSAQRIVTRGYGKSYPIAANDNESGRQLNRRVEVVILDPGQSAIEATRARLPLPAAIAR